MVVFISYFSTSKCTLVILCKAYVGLMWSACGRAGVRGWPRRVAALVAHGRRLLSKITHDTTNTLVPALKIWYIYIRFLIYGAQEKGQYIRNLIYGAQRNFVYINFLLKIFKKSLQNTIKINGILKIVSHILKTFACGALIYFIF